MYYRGVSRDLGAIFFVCFLRRLLLFRYRLAVNDGHCESEGVRIYLQVARANHVSGALEYDLVVRRPLGGEFQRRVVACGEEGILLYGDRVGSLLVTANRARLGLIIGGDVPRLVLRGQRILVEDAEGGEIMVLPLGFGVRFNFQCLRALRSPTVCAVLRRSR